ncbi:MAG: AAA family ATPase [Tannerella sp.]|jgi:wobble nucleotide-excising tRNase|nr:AAA family ATPase [Tannerella sp.]
MIESIAIKNVATFDNTGIIINNLKKVNFIYGANGSGKTTISNLLASPEDFKDKACAVSWKNNIPLKVVSYNKQFREQHFNKGKIPGVFTLGSATKEQLDKIEALKGELSTIKESGLQKTATVENQTKEKTNLENQFTEDCWVNIKKKNEQLFNEAFRGYINSKKSFSDKIIQEYQHKSRPLKTREELSAKATIIFGETPQRMDEILSIEYARLIEIENNKIWQKKIIGKQDIEIAKLIQRLNINDWVNQGRQLIEGDLDVCPFCQKKTIDTAFRSQLENYFDETFVFDSKLIKDLYDEYVTLLSNLSNTLQNIESKEAENKNSKLNLQLFSPYLKTLNQQIIANREFLNTKLKEPSRSIELVSVQEQLEQIQSLIDNANIEIRKHNAVVDNFALEKEGLIKDVWRFFTEDYKTTIETYRKNTDGLQKGIDALQKQTEELRKKYKEKDADLKDANKNVTSVQPSVDAINTLLASYGFENFKIVPSKAEANHYQIEREDGTIAEKTLSEGEVTFITFLYYLQLAQGGFSQDSVSEERVLVVDDPISSLDSTVLFVVSSLLKEIIKSIKHTHGNIKQIIILTHNVYFHKEISFVDRTDNNRDDVCFWILRKNGNTSNIQCYEKKNPIRGSYELLWDELKQQDKLSGITTQNIMRRILETYFKTMGRFTDDSIINSFDDKYEKEICRSLLCWVNDGSHCISDDLHVEFPDAINSKFADVFKSVFQNMGHIEHYNMMMGIEAESEKEAAL